MQVIKVVFAFLAIGGTGYALFKLQNDTPTWVKVLSFIMAGATLIVAITYLPQALGALEESAQTFGKWFVKPEEEARRKAAEEMQRRAADETIRRQEEERRKADEQALRKIETVNIRSVKVFSTRIQGRAVIHPQTDGFVRIEMQTGAVYRNPDWGGITFFLEGVNIGYCRIGEKGWDSLAWVPLLSNIHKLIDATNWVSLNGLVGTLQLPPTDPTLSKHWLCVQAVLRDNAPKGGLGFTYGHSSNAPFNFN